MRFLVDAQLPPALARFLEARGHEARAAREVGLRQAEDPVVWTSAQTGAWIVVTRQDPPEASPFHLLPHPPTLAEMRAFFTARRDEFEIELASKALEERRRAGGPEP
jgi:predicted nuclease of predicted toxin-antitoxin system